MQSCAEDCSWIYVHDGQCDKSCNVPSCQMDGGDCENNDVVSRVNAYLYKCNFD